MVKEDIELLCNSSIVIVECFRYRENSNNYYKKHMKLTISVVRDDQVHPLHYLIDTSTYTWEKATIRIMGLYGHTLLLIFFFQIANENKMYIINHNC